MVFYLLSTPKCGTTIPSQLGAWLPLFFLLRYKAAGKISESGIPDRL